MKEKIYLIGIGKVGSAFAFELNEAGFNIAFVTDRNSDKIENISSLNKKIRVSDKIEKKFVEESDCIIISVQDKFLDGVISSIKEFNLDLKDKFLIHTSGAVSSEIFISLNINSKNIASLHPIQTFDKVSSANQNLLKNIYFGIEGGQEGINLSKKIVAGLKSDFIEIPKSKKYLYHTACVVASNFLVTILNISSEIMNNLGADKNKTFEIFQPLIETTLKNIKNDGLVNSLTGPYDRNDIETISNHLSSINKELPSLLPFYTLMGMETVKVAFKKESLNLKNVIEILDLLNEYINTESIITNKNIN